MACVALPAYQASPHAPPDYTTAPLEDEQTLAFTPRPGVLDRHGSFTRFFKKATVILKEQDENSQLPTYSRGATVNGEIGLNCPENVVEVSAKLYGQMSLMAAEYGSGGATLISDSHTLWKSQAARAHDNDCPRCPSILPFAIPFPITYTTPGGKTLKLPPSFETTFSGIPALFARCTYSLSITIVKTRRYRLASWNASKTFNIMLQYRPRTRPRRPVVMVGSIFSSLKPVPEEWLQLMMTMETRLGSSATPIECHLLIPSVQTFAIADPIPFHLQLCSSLASLQELIPPNSCLLDPPARRDNSFAPTHGTDGIRVYIVRQIHVEIGGRRRVRTVTIGESQMDPIPPVMSEAYSTDEVCLDWQGEVRCWRDVTCGGFSAGDLLVKDFLVLALTPTMPRSPLLGIQLTHAIRLVTDSWIDLDGVHPHDL